MKFIDISNQRFNKLTVISLHDRKNNRIRWLCKCDCGKEVITTLCSLSKGKRTSCGCLRSERQIIHNMSKSKIYMVWRNIKTRCYNKNSSDYHRYGGRGISLDVEFVDSFKSFYEYVSTLENFNIDGYTIDRIDNNGNYSKGNLRWSSKKTQARNRNNSLNEDVINEIRNLHSTGKYSLSELSKTFDTSRSNIIFIVKNKTWVQE